MMHTMTSEIATNTDEIETLKKWVSCLLNDEKYQLEEVDPEFGIENAMTLEEYWENEKNNFNQLSKLFELDNDFKIEIVHKYPLQYTGIKNTTIQEQVRHFHYSLHLINSQDKLVCKMGVTLKKVNDKYFVSGNNYKVQIVSKLVLFSGVVKEVGLALKPLYPITHIISPDLDFIEFEKGQNFQEDGFYSARFLTRQSIEEKLIEFHIYMKNGKELIKEKRWIYFEKLNPFLKPYELIHDDIVLQDDKYPVNLVAISKYHPARTFHESYPRKKSVNIHEYEECIITDCMDNDWHINLEFIRNS